MNTLRINSLLLALLIGLNVFTPAQAGQAKPDHVAICAVGAAVISAGCWVSRSEDERAAYARTQLKKAAPLFVYPAFYASKQIPTGVSYVVRNLPTLIAYLPTLTQMGKIGAVGAVVGGIGYALHNAQPTEKPKTKTNNSESWISHVTEKVAKAYNETQNNIGLTFGAVALAGILMNENSPLHKYEGWLGTAYTAAVATGFLATLFAPEKTDAPTGTPPTSQAQTTAKPPVKTAAKANGKQ